MVVLIAVGAGPVEAYDTCVVLPYFRDSETSHDETAQPQIITILVAQYVDGVCLSLGVGKQEALSVALDGAVLAHALAGSEEHRSLCDVLDNQSRRQAAVFIVHLAFLAGEKDY